MEEKPRKAPFLYWLWMPILHNIVLYVSFGALSIVIKELHGNDWGGVFIGGVGFMILMLVFVPLMTITYCKRIRSLGWKKYLCCLYDAVMIEYFELNGEITLKLLFVYLLTPQAIMFFAVALLCGLFTLLYYNRKDKHPEPKEVPIGNGYIDGGSGN